MATLKFLGALFTTNVKAAVSLRGAFLLQVGMMAVNDLLLFVFWWILFQRFPNIGGWQIGDMLLLYGTVCTGFGLAVVTGGGVLDLGRAIHEGGLDVYLTQPKDVLVQALGSRSVTSGFGDVATGVVLLSSSGKLSLENLPLAVIAVLASGSVFLAVGVLFHSSAFWLGNVSTLARQAWEFVLAFSLQPEPIFAGRLRALLFTLLPAGFVGFLPAALVREPSWSGLFSAMGGAVLFIGLARVAFRLGLRRYVSGNRMTVRA